MCKPCCPYTGVVQPWSPCWRGFQAAAVDTDWTRPFRAVLGRQHFAPKCFVQKVCLNCVYTVHQLCGCRILFFQHKSLKTNLHFLDAETQKIQIQTCLAALPSSMCISSLSKKTTVLLLRWEWYTQATFVGSILYYCVIIVLSLLFKLIFNAGIWVVWCLHMHFYITNVELTSHKMLHTHKST